MTDMLNSLLKRLRSQPIIGAKIKIIIIIVLLILFVILSLHHHGNKDDILTTENIEENSVDSKCEMNHADDNWLYRSRLIYNNSAAAGHWTAINPDQSSVVNYLRSYSLGAASNCLDAIRTTCLSQPDDVLRIVFIGDSRIRNQFYNFVKFLPKTDLVTEPEMMQVGLETIFDFHKDRNVSSNLIGLNISYLWRPRLDDELISSIEDLIHQNQPPYLVIIGLGGHHMMKRIIDSPNHHNLEIFEQRMEKFLVPAMRSLIAVGTRIIWMSQFPMLPDHKGPDNRNVIGGTTTELLDLVNRISRRLLKNSGVKFWDSGNQPMEENVRACIPMNGALLRNPDTIQFSHVVYFKCDDLVHPSFVSTSHTIQILLNHLCNRHDLLHYNHVNSSR